MKFRLCMLRRRGGVEHRHRLEAYAPLRGLRNTSADRHDFSDLFPGLRFAPPGAEELLCLKACCWNKSWK
jgi:hypothetical protein